MNIGLENVARRRSAWASAGWESRAVDVEPVGDGCADLLGQTGLGESFSQSSRRPPRRITLIVGGTHGKGSISVCVSCELGESIGGDLANRCQVAPLVGVGLELLVEKLGVAVVACASLQRERDEVAEPARRQHVLAREQSVVGLDADGCAACHRACQDRETEPACVCCGYRVREEEPHVGAITGPRTLHGGLDAERLAHVGEQLRVRPPAVAVEIDRQQPARVVGEQRIEPDDLLATEMRKQLLDIERGERLALAGTTADLRFGADSWPPLVCASW